MKINILKRALITGLMFLALSNLTATAQVQKESEEKTIKYGVQVWTAINLNVDHFRNGDPIPEAATAEEWVKAASERQPAWCYYENDPANAEVYGRLYNWYAVNDKRGLAPEGWHIPGNSDWRTLVKNLKGVDMAGTKLKSSENWKTRKGTNDIGFTALPAGYREPDGKFRDLGVVGRWWSNSVPVDVKPSDKIYTVRLSDKSFELKYLESDKGAGCSVRCEKD